MLPNALDVPAAMGSDTALALLRDAGATNYDGYAERMETTYVFDGSIIIE